MKIIMPRMMSMTVTVPIEVPVDSAIERTESVTPSAMLSEKLISFGSYSQSLSITAE